MKVLLIAPQDVIPPTDGGKVGIFHPVKYLAQKYEVYLAFPMPKLSDEIKTEIISKYAVYNIKAIPFELNTSDNYFFYIKNIFSKIPFKMAKYFKKNFLSELKEIIKKENINIVHINHSHVGKYAIELKKEFPDLKIFLREHNIEYQIVKQYSNIQKNIFLKIFAYFEYLKTKRYEISLWDKFNQVFFISNTDLEEAKKYNHKFNESNLIYDGMEIDDNDKNPKIEEKSFIFSGFNFMQK